MAEVWRGRTTGVPDGNWSVTDIRGDGTRPPGYIERAAGQDRRGTRAHPDQAVNREVPPLYETLAIGIAEEALNLIGMLDREPGNRVLILTRQRELRARLDALVRTDYR